MRTLGEQIDATLAGLPQLDTGELWRARRVRQVRDIWAQLVEQPILDHTNAVYIFTRDGQRQMHVYVDESIYAAELNNRRELLKLQCLERFGEQLDSFNIHISRGARKAEHPYAARPAPPDQRPPVPLDADELARLDQAAAPIEPATLRTSFRRAMQADLEWKKGQRPGA